jgi:iron complex outermembrane receptor protein
MKFSLLPLAAAIALASSVHAETNELPSVAVSASRLDADSAGTLVYVINREQIHQSSARNISELLASIPGLHVRSLSGNPFTEGTIDLRGFGPAAGQNTLILVDGRRLNDVDLSSTDIGGVSISAIERIEVQPGGGSVLYGDGASGGTINIITRHATENSASLNLTAANFDTKGATASAQLAGKAGSLALFGQHMETDGYRDNSDVRRDSLGANLRFNVAPGQEGFLLVNGSRLDSRLPGARTVDPGLNQDDLHDNPRGTTTPNDWADEERHQLVAGWQVKLNDNTTLIIDGSHRLKEQWSFFDYGFGFSDYVDTDLASISATPRLNVVYRTGAMAHELKAGYDWYRTDYSSRRGQTPGAAPIHDIGIDAETSSPYLFQTSRWSDTSVSLGARQSRVKQNSRDVYDAAAPGGAFDSQAAPDSQRFKEEMYEGGISQALSPALTASIGASRSVRLGTVDETYEYDAFFNRVFSPLRPQIGHNVEGSLAFDQKGTRLTATVYRQKLRDEIQFNPVAFTNDNIDPTLRRGITIGASTRLLETITLSGSLTEQRSEFREGANKNNDVPLVPPPPGSFEYALAGNAHVEYCAQRYLYRQPVL